MNFIKLIIVTLLIHSYLFASHWSVEFFSGDVYNFKEDVTLKQDGQDDVKLNDVSFNTHPRNIPPYYGYRIALWNDNKAWEYEFIHHKLYIDNPKKYSSDLTKWEVTDGFNMFFLNRAWKNDQNLVYRVGGGLLLSHPDVELRGKNNFERGAHMFDYSKGYYWSGYAMLLSVQKRYEISKKLFAGAELKFTYAKSDIPIAEGSMQFDTRTIHFNVGLGYKF